MIRPFECEGCPCNPTSARFDFNRVGDFVPPNSCGLPISTPAVGAWDIDLLIIAMAPSYAEEEEGEPLVGPSFFEIKRALGTIGLTRPLRVRKINIVNCRTRKPGASVEWVNRDPTAAEIKACVKRWLIPELRALARAESEERKIVLWTLGNLVFNTLSQGQFGTFAGSKSSRGQRLTASPTELADRLEKWIRGNQKARLCIRCNQPFETPRVRICDTCRGGAPEPKVPKPRKKKLPVPAPTIDHLSVDDDDVPF